jgi:hypothetical protein
VTEAAIGTYIDKDKRFQHENKFNFFGSELFSTE